LEIRRLDTAGGMVPRAHAVVFFESTVTDYQVLRQGLALGTDAVLLDGGGDGLKEMAAFLAAYHDLTSIGVVAHGAAGQIMLGTASLDGASLSHYSAELARIGSALGPGGELDLWSCDVAAGASGSSLVRALAAATGAAVAAADHTVGSAALAGDWQLDVRLGGARAEIPFSADAVARFPQLLDSFGPAASITTARAFQTATLLNNGKVLIAGGQGNNGYLASAELYDPASNTWTSAGSMATARFLHTATLLNNGKVLIVGGFGNSGFLASAELYDPISNSWSSAGSLGTARDLHTATLLSNGKVLITGGFKNGVLASAELYDPLKNAWAAAGSLATARDQHTATLLANGNVLVTGGLNGSSAAVAAAELYDPVANTWSSAGAMATARYFQSATLLPSGKVLVAGGVGNNFNSLAGAELYDPGTNAWSPAASLATARDQQTATLLASGKVLVSGGIGNADLASAEVYDPTQDTWSAAASLLTARTNQTATLLNNGQVLIVGGSGATGWLASAELYDPAGNSGIQFVVSVLGNGAAVAGTPFLITAQAVDAFGKPIANYTGPANFSISPTPADPVGNWPVTGTLNGSGFAFLQGNLKTAGSFTLTAAAGSFKGTSAAVAVAPAAAAFFKVSSPATAITGSAATITVTAMDQFGNIATGYQGQVHFTSSDTLAALPADATLVGGTGVFNVTLNTAGNQTITATDAVSAVPLTITGTSAAITTRGLTVTSFTATPTGFTASFSKPFLPNALTLYGSGLHTVQDVTLVGAVTGPISGSLLIDPSNMSATFNATSNFLLLTNNFAAPVLPDDTYTATLVSGTGTNAFMDALGASLDGTASGGHANYTTTFTTHYVASNTSVLAMSDFARGPDGAHAVDLPNGSGLGIPITLYGAAGVTDMTFTLTYNPALLTVTGGSNAAATDPNSSFALVGNPLLVDATHAVASFHFQSSKAQSATAILGSIQATVPNSAAASYKSKELLQLGAIQVNGAAFTGVAANSIHVNAYLGDVTGNGTIDALDVATANTVAQGTATGFAAYSLLDPAVVGDIAADFSVDAGAVSDLASFTSRLPLPAIPPPPTGMTITPVGADPTLSLGAAQRQGDKEKGRQGKTSTSSGLVVTVPVMLDDPHPFGSTGMTEAILALTYDPTVLSVSAADITLGTIPASGSGWQMEAVVDQTTGQIGIELFSTTPITASAAGSLVNITFHVQSRRRLALSAVQLVNKVSADGQEFTTQITDAQGQLVLGFGNVSATLTSAWPAPRERRDVAPW
jgi:N-acetylneuraminic acid mutarotase